MTPRRAAAGRGALTSAEVPACGCGEPWKVSRGMAPEARAASEPPATASTILEDTPLLATAEVRCTQADVRDRPRRRRRRGGADEEFDISRR